MALIQKAIKLPISLIKKAWNGEERLWVVFWVYFVLVNFLGIYKIVPSVEDFEVDSLLWLNIQFSISIILTIIVRLFLIVSIWKCAFNCNYNICGYLSRALAIVFGTISVYGITGTITHIINMTIKHENTIRVLNSINQN